MDLVKTTLDQALATLAAQLNLDPAALSAFAAEDHIGGFNMDVNRRRWATGSIWEVEGKVLFALVRALKPEHVVEIGTWFGCGASHILEALALNKRGTLTSIDTDPNAGSEIPTSLRKRWKFIHARGQDAIAAGQVAAADMVFEDAPHDIEETATILAAARDGLKPRLIISHDGMHFNVGVNVREAYRRTFGQDPQAVLIDPSDCGFAWQVLRS
jgi:predicted O-methyltransferase YrrM